MTKIMVARKWDPKPLKLKPRVIEIPLEPTAKHPQNPAPIVANMQMTGNVMNQIYVHQGQIQMTVALLKLRAREIDSHLPFTAVISTAENGAPSWQAIGRSVLRVSVKESLGAVLSVNKADPIKARVSICESLKGSLPSHTGAFLT